MTKNGANSISLDNIILDATILKNIIGLALCLIASLRDDPGKWKNLGGQFSDFILNDEMKGIAYGIQ
jgi:hypothetical protein